MKAFVTGGTGFLGLNLIHQLIDKDWQVIAMFRAGANITELEKLNITLVETDLLNKSHLMNNVPSELDAIFHIAGDTNMWRLNNARQYQVNVTATQNLIDVALSKQVKRFIHTSSISAYGFHKKIITESSHSNALQSSVNYLKTKYLGEKAVKDAVTNKGLDAVILNPCAIIGPYDKHNWSQLFTMINNGSLPGAPAGEGSYCHVREVAAAHIAAFERGKIGENYILAGTDCSFLDVVRKIGNLLDKPTPNKPIPSVVIKTIGALSYWLSLFTKQEPNMTPEKAQMVTERVKASSDKAVKELGYNNKVSLDEMLNDCYLWMKQENML